MVCNLISLLLYAYCLSEAGHLNELSVMKEGRFLPEGTDTSWRFIYLLKKSIHNIHKNKCVPPQTNIHLVTLDFKLEKKLKLIQNVPILSQGHT